VGDAAANDLCKIRPCASRGGCRTPPRGGDRGMAPGGIRRTAPRIPRTLKGSYGKEPVDSAPSGPCHSVWRWSRGQRPTATHMTSLRDYQTRGLVVP